MCITASQMCYARLLCVLAALPLGCVGIPSLAGITYDVLGPFPAGNREVADPVAAFGDIDVLHAEFKRSPASPRLFPSELADGGNITWSNATADATGTVSFPFPTVRFDFLQQAFGPFLLALQGWAFGA